MIRKSTIFFLSCFAFVLGIALHSFFFPNLYTIKPLYLYTIVLIIGIGVAISYIFTKDRRVLTVLLVGSLFILGLWRYATSIPFIDESQIAFYTGQELKLRGIISDEPDIREKSTRYTIEISSYQPALYRPPTIGRGTGAGFPISNGHGKSDRQKIRGKLLVIAKSFPEYQYGDVIEFKCKLEKPEPVEDFDYGAYLARYDIYSLCRFPENLRLIASNQGSQIMSGLYFVKNKFITSVNRILPEPQASFLGGLLYGAKRSIPPDLKESFKRTGTSHLVALSGYNISIVAGFITATLSWFWIPRRLAFPLAVLAILGFILLTGAQASVVRAGIMGLVVLLAKNIGRLSRARNILTFSAVVMLMQNPKILAWDMGFQLSFAATVGLLVFSPYFAEKLKFLPTWLNLREAAAATLAALFFTLPLLLYNFGIFSLIAPLANILVVPFIPLSMLMGFLAAASALIWPPFGIFAGWFAWLPLTYEIKVIQWLARFPVVETRVPLAVFLGMYGIIIVVVYKITQSAKLKSQIHNLKT